MLLNPDPIAWAETEAELLAINRAFCRIHDTPSPEQHVRLKELRAQARRCGQRRNDLVIQARAEQLKARMPC